MLALRKTTNCAINTVKPTLKSNLQGFLFYRVSRTTIRCALHRQKKSFQTTENMSTSRWRSLKVKSRVWPQRKMISFLRNALEPPPQTLIEETIVKMSQLNYSTASNKTKMEFVEFSETTVIKLLSHRAADEVTWECLERWLKSEKFMWKILKRAVSNPFCIWPVARFFKQQGEKAIDECGLAEQ